MGRKTQTEIDLNYTIKTFTLKKEPTNYQSSLKTTTTSAGCISSNPARENELLVSPHTDGFGSQGGNKTQDGAFNY